MKEKLKVAWSKIADYIVMTVGVVISAAAVNLFFVPYKIHSGGVSGIATVLYYIFNNKVPVGVLVAILNLPLFLIGYRIIGKRFMIRTLYATVMYTVAVDVTAKWLSEVSKKITIESGNIPDLMLFCFFGGALMGLGLGIVFTRNSCTGGSDLFAEIMRRKGIHYSIGTLMFMFDGVSVLMSLIVFKNLLLVLYSVIAIFVSMKVIDLILDGANVAKAVYIMSDKSEEIADAIINDIGRGVTGFAGRGMYFKQSRETLFCVVKNRQLPALKKLVKELDSKAFLIVTTAHQVLGEGFGAFDKEL